MLLLPLMICAWPEPVLMFPPKVIEVLRVKLLMLRLPP
jgi:hypothetical protein